MGNARRKALFSWYKKELGFSSAEARTLRNRSEGWYDDYKAAQRDNPSIKPPRWTPDKKERQQRAKFLRQNGVPSETARKLRGLSGVKFSGAKRSISGTLAEFEKAVGKRKARRAFRDAFERVAKHSEMQAAIAAIYAQFRPQSVQPRRRGQRPGAREGRIR